MSLKPYQEQITLSRLYKANLAMISGESEQLKANIFINSGSIDVYGSNSATQPTSLSDMILEVESSDVSGIEEFAMIPTWLAFVQNSGTSTDIVTSGLELKDLGGIS